MDMGSPNQQMSQMFQQYLSMLAGADRNPQLLQQVQAATKSQDVNQQIAAASAMNEYNSMKTAQQAQQNANPPTIMEQKAQQAQASLRPQMPMGGMPLQMAPQAGLPAVAQAPQFADPMQAGLAAVPENEASEEEKATGGLVSLAQGGEVRGFDGRQGSYAYLNPNAGPTPDFSTLNPFSEDASPTLQDIQKQAGGDARIRQGLFDGKQDARSGVEEFLKSQDLGDADKTQYPKTSFDRIKSNIAGAFGYEPIDTDRDPETGMEKNKKVEPHPEAKAPSKTSNKGIPAAKLEDGVPDWAAEASNQGEAGLLYPGAALDSVGLPAGIPRAQQIAYGTPRTPDAQPDTSNTTPNQGGNIPYDKQIEEISKLMGTPYAQSAELKAQYEKENADANSQKWALAGVQGLGAMLSAATPWKLQALGHGLMTGASTFGAEGQREDQMTNKLLAGSEEADRAANEQHQKAMQMWWNQKMAESAQNAGLNKEILGRAVSGQYAGVNRLLGAKDPNAIKPLSYKDAAALAQKDLVNDYKAVGLNQQQRQDYIDKQIQHYMTNGATGGGSSQPFNVLRFGTNGELIR